MKIKPQTKQKIAFALLGLAALIVGLQPMITALWISARGHRHHVSGRQWLGLVLGLAGLLLVPAAGCFYFP